MNLQASFNSILSAGIGAAERDERKKAAAAKEAQKAAKAAAKTTVKASAANTAKPPVTAPTRTREDVMGELSKRANDSYQQKVTFRNMLGGYTTIEKGVHKS